MSSDIDVIKAVYAAFGRGDLAEFLSHLHDDVQWEAWADNHAQRAEVPYLARLNGKAEVPKFFAALGGIELQRLEILNFLAGPGAVGVEVEIEFIVKATGKRLADQELHLWSLADGKVTRLRHYADTAKHIAANRA
jgi:ketosteroid isomerase-like protein